MKTKALGDWTNRNKVWLLLSAALIAGGIGVWERQNQMVKVRQLRAEIQSVRHLAKQLLSRLDKIEQRQGELRKRQAEITAELQTLKRLKSSPMPKVKTYALPSTVSPKPKRSPAIGSQSAKYIGDLVLGEFHMPYCRVVEERKRSILRDKLIPLGSGEEAEKRGFAPCWFCKP